VNFEDDLREALRREPAPPDFAAKVLAHNALARTAPTRRLLVLALAAALLLAAAIPPAVYRYRRHERAIHARDQLVAALSMTRAQLQQAKEKILRNTRSKI
jgi:hypothetical protein